MTYLQEIRQQRKNKLSEEKGHKIIKINDDKNKCKYCNKLPYWIIKKDLKCVSNNEKILIEKQLKNKEIEYRKRFENDAEFQRLKDMINKRYNDFWNSFNKE